LESLGLTLDKVSTENLGKIEKHSKVIETLIEGLNLNEPSIQKNLSLILNHFATKEVEFISFKILEKSLSEAHKQGDLIVFLP
jgi:hypothetical protein